MAGPVPKLGDEPKGWKTAATALCRRIVNEAELNKPLATAEKEWFLQLLEARHPSWKWKSSKGVIELFIRNHPDPRYRNRQICIVQTDGQAVSVSWTKCVSPPSHEAKCREAMRHAIENQIETYRRSVPFMCMQCSITNDRMEVDHHPVTFAELAVRYASELGGWEGVKVDETASRCSELEGSRLGAADLEVWSLYHQTYATYRLLCKLCHRKAT